MQLFLLLLVLATAAVSKPIEETDKSLLWGPYRPNLYFGIRPRLPQSLMTGLIWFSTVSYQSVQSAFAILATRRGTRVLIVAFQGSRHACEQDDKLDSYTWTQYDPREGGVQEIKDSQNNVKITTEFLKVPGGKNGGSWAARIKGEPMDTCEQRRTDSPFLVVSRLTCDRIPYSETHAHFCSVLLRSRRPWWPRNAERTNTPSPLYLLWLVTAGGIC